MAFEWERFLVEHQISYVDRGANINRFELGIRCPFCGNADPSEHMAIHRSRGSFRCRRDSSGTHAGRSPHRLIQALIGCSFPEAARLVGDQSPTTMVDDQFVAQVQRMMAPRQTTEAIYRPTHFPPEFKPLSPFGMGRIFWKYMTSRHYTPDQVHELVARYDLHFATKGRYGYRLIVPVYNKQGLMSWTGRAISSRTEVRYLTYSALDYPKDEAPPILSIKDLLLNEDDLEAGGKVLIVAEGPFDALRIDYFGKPHGIRGTCFFGKSVSPDQMAKLLKLSKYYDRCVVVLDKDAQLDAFGIQQKLARGGYQTHHLVGDKDPAALDEVSLKKMIHAL